VNIGTLSAFIVICASVLILRIRQPELERRFRTPALWLLAPLGIVFSLFLIIGWPWVTDGQFRMIGGLDIVTMWRFVIWMAIGLAEHLLSVGHRRQVTLERRAGHRHRVALRDLDGDGPGDLLLLRHAPQQARQRRALLRLGVCEEIHFLWFSSIASPVHARTRS